MNLSFLLKAGVSLIFCLVLIVKIDLGQLMTHLSSIGPGYYIISCLLLIVNMVLLAVKYKAVMEPTGIHRSIGELVRINFICRFYSMFLSSAVGQTVIRWYYSTKDSENRFRFIATLFYERISFVFAIVAFLLACTPMMPIPMATAFLQPVIFFTGFFLLFVSVCFAYLVHPRTQQVIDGWILRLSSRFHKAFPNRIKGIIDAFSIYCNRSRTLLLSVALALLWHVSFVLRVYFLMVSLDTAMSLVQLTWMASFVLLLQSIPLTFNGIGIREGAYAFFFELLGLEPEKGASLGVLLLTQIILISVIGGLIHWFSKE